MSSGLVLSQISTFNNYGNKFSPLTSGKSVLFNPKNRQDLNFVLPSNPGGQAQNSDSGKMQLISMISSGIAALEVFTGLASGEKAGVTYACTSGGELLLNSSLAFGSFFNLPKNTVHKIVSILQGLIGCFILSEFFVQEHKSHPGFLKKLPIKAQNYSKQLFGENHRRVVNTIQAILPVISLIMFIIKHQLAKGMSSHQDAENLRKSANLDGNCGLEALLVALLNCGIFPPAIKEIITKIYALIAGGYLFGDGLKDLWNDLSRNSNRPN